VVIFSVFVQKAASDPVKEKSLPLRKGPIVDGGTAPLCIIFLFYSTPHDYSSVDFVPEPYAGQSIFPRPIAPSCAGGEAKNSRNRRTGFFLPPGGMYVPSLKILRIKHSNNLSQEQINYYQ
jgi:hypothetical protein